MVKLLLLCLITGLSLFTSAAAQTPVNTNKSQSLKFDFDLAQKRAVENRNNKIIRNGSIFGSPDSSQYYALIICGQNYDDKKYSTLSWPIDYGTKLREVLIKNYKFDANNVMMILDPTRSQLFQVLDKLTSDPPDNLLIFYTGHGSYDTKFDRGYWIPCDADHDNRGSWFANLNLKDYIANINTQHTLVIADACFAGTLAKLKGDKSESELDKFNTAEELDGQQSELKIQSYFGYPTKKVMTSGSTESVPDQSSFVEVLIRTLKNSTIKHLPAAQLFKQIKKFPIGQTTPLFNTVPGCISDDRGDFIFTRRQ